MSIELELLRVIKNDGTELKKVKDEDRQDYLVKILKVVDKIIGEDDDLWESISREAQEWITQGIHDYEREKIIEDFSDKEEAEEVKKEVVKKEVVKKDGTFLLAEQAIPRKFYEINVNDEIVKVECIRIGEEKVVFEDEEGERYRKSLRESIKISIIAEKEDQEEDQEEELEGTIEEDEKEEKEEESVIEPEGKEEEGEKVKESEEKVKEKDTEERPQKIAEPLSIAAQIRMIICLHPEWTTKEVEAELKVHNCKYKKSTLTVEYQGVHRVLRMLKELGKFENE